MNKYSVFYNLGRVEGVLRVLSSVVHDSILSCYSDRELEFYRETCETLSALDDVYNYVVSQADDPLFNYLEGFQPGRKEDANDGE